MRGTADRLRHAISFEIIGLVIVTPLSAWVFDKALADMGLIGIVAASTATVWNYVYNLGFDHALLRLSGHVRKGPWLRVFHALAFEAGLLALLLPFIAWYLGIGLREAFVMDAALAGFYVVYAYVFNWAYDVIFPVPAGSSRTS